MERIFDYFRANPAGNITGFVLGNVEKQERPIIANAIIEQIDDTVEQVGFISEDSEGKYRMDMMGGEFCGNATRSFGLFVSIAKELKGYNKLYLKVSGTEDDIEVITNTDEMTSEISLSPAKKTEYVSLLGKEYFTVFLDGIIHTIIDDREENIPYTNQIIDELKGKFSEDAYGCLFLNKNTLEMVPFVYVSETDTLIREGSCGSGTIATGYYLNQNQDPDFSAAIIQPGGVIEVKARPDEDKILYSIGGEVEFGRLEEITLEI